MEVVNQINPVIPPEPVAQPQAEPAFSDAADKNPAAADFTDIEAEIKALGGDKQPYEKAIEDSKGGTRDEPEDETESDKEETGGKKEKEKAIDSEFVDEGAEMMFNVSDFAFSGLNSWLNKEPEQAEDYEATQKGKRLIIKNLKAYFRTFEIKITPGQALFYSYVVVYGFDFFAGLITRVKDLFKKLLTKKQEPVKNVAAQQPAAPATNNGIKLAPTEIHEPAQPHTEEEIKKALRSKKEERYRKEGLKPCKNPDCDKDEGANQWCAKDRQFCSGSCRTIIQNKERKEKKASSTK